MARTPKGGYGIVGRHAMTMDGPSYGAKANYALLCAYTGDKEHCFPSIETQAKNLKVSQATIKRWHKELEKFGMMEKGKLNPGAWDRRNKYEVTHPEPIEPQGLTDEPMQGLTDELNEGLASEPIEGLTHDPVILTPKTNNKKNNKGAKPPGFTRRCSDLICEAHLYLTKEPLEWRTRAAVYGKDLQTIIAILSKEPDEEKAFQKLREKCAALVAAAQADPFYRKQGITPTSLRTFWDKVHYTGQNIAAINGKKFPNYKAMTAEQIRKAFTGWNNYWTTFDLQENLPPETYAAFQQAGGYAPKLAELLVAEVHGGTK